MIKTPEKNKGSFSQFTKIAFVGLLCLFVYLFFSREPKTEPKTEPKIESGIEARLIKAERGIRVNRELLIKIAEGLNEMIELEKEYKKELEYDKIKKDLEIELDSKIDEIVYGL